MRICSLLPSATEIVFALGLGDDLVGVSYACDYPDEAASRPVVSHSLRNIKHLDSGEIDALVQQARANNNPMYWIDDELLARLRPDLIITQELCEVCAIASGSVFETSGQGPGLPAEHPDHPPQRSGRHPSKRLQHRRRRRGAGTGPGTAPIAGGAGQAGHRWRPSTGSG